MGAAEAKEAEAEGAEGEVGTEGDPETAGEAGREKEWALGPRPT